MNEAVEQLYFNWLCARVINMNEADSGPAYWKLLTRLHRTEFVWVVFRDDNRAEDGKELRREFILQAELPDDVEWRTIIGCSVLEMLIALARRLEFQEDTPAHEWFWEFIRNLGLSKYSDNLFDDYAVDEILDAFIWRTYEPNGHGGIFPLYHTDEDQREIEIWYQMCEYLVDHDRLP
jgi:hypothetical protein